MSHKRFMTILLCLLVTLASWPLAGWDPVGSAQASAPVPSTIPNPIVQEIIDQVTPSEFSNVDGGLSGEYSIVVGSQIVTLTTRYTPSTQGTLSEQYVYEYFQALGLQTSYHSWSYCSITGRNVIAEIPGSLDPTRIYLITAHLDSTSPQPLTLAQGADDNGSGTTAVMLAARILSAYTFDYTLRFVAFTGEESGLCGSNRYANAARSRNDDIRGVINLDMIAYDGNGVNDVEIHAGTRSDSRAVADLLIANVSTYNLDLIPHLLTGGSTTASDHASFWSNNYPAILGIEYAFGGDFNPYYHNSICCDVLSHLDLGMATAYTKASLATLALLAGAHRASSTPTPTITPTSTPTMTPVSLIVGHVTWQGRPAQPHLLQQLPVTLTVKSGVTEVNYPAQTTDVYGFFTLSTNLPSGTFWWRTKHPKYLANSGTLVLVGAPRSEVEIGLMRVGDANNDNVVNVPDFNILKVAMGTAIGDPGYDDRADFDGNQAISIADFNLLKGNFGVAGAAPLGPMGP